MQPANIAQLFDGVGEDGYGGMDPGMYTSIVEFIKTRRYPPFIEDSQKINRNAQFHWRSRCSRFVLSISDTLLYVEKQNSDRTRIVVKRGEARVAIKVLHERSGHSGQKQTQMLVARRLYWSGIRRDVTRFVNECRFCKSKRELRKPVLLEDHSLLPAIGTEEGNIADRLLLNVSEPMLYVDEYVDELEPYEEVVMDDMDDSMLFSQDHHSSHHFDNEKELGGMLNDKVEVGAEEIISNDDHSVDINTLIEERSLNHEESVSDRKAERRRHVNQQDPLLSSEVNTKRRKTFPDDDNQGVNSARRYDQDYKDPHHFIEEYPLQPNSNAAHRYVMEAPSPLGAPMTIASVDPEVVRLQKAVLNMQYDVLALKKEYLKEKLAKLRSSRRNSATLQSENVDIEV